MGMQMLNESATAMTPAGTVEHRCGDPVAVAEVRTALIDPTEAARLADLFKLLGDPTRARILDALRLAGELCVSDLAEAVGAPESTVSHALRLLRTAGVVRNRREGRLVHYSLDDDHVVDLLERSLGHVRHLADDRTDGGRP